MQAPPDYMLPILHSIESIVLLVWEEFPSLTNKDVELSYAQLKTYYKKISSGANKKVEEPLSTSERRQALMDEILNILDLRKEKGGDNFIIKNESYYHGDRMYANHEYLYSIAISRLHKSVRLWKAGGGYLNFIKNQVI
jgi:hypothetical protein